MLWAIVTAVQHAFQLILIELKFGLWVFVRGSGQLGPKTSRPRTTRPMKKSAQDNSAQVVPISEDNSAQIAQTAEDHSAHKNQTRHLLMY